MLDLLSFVFPFFSNDAAECYGQGLSLCQVVVELVVLSAVGTVDFKLLSVQDGLGFLCGEAECSLAFLTVEGDCVYSWLNLVRWPGEGRAVVASGPPCAC